MKDYIYREREREGGIIWWLASANTRFMSVNTRFMSVNTHFVSVNTGLGVEKK